jgi:glycine/D-amino acid oxidase-like deaminating enzyme
VTVEAIEIAGGKVRGARVGGELLECDALVLAAGPWSRALFDLPLEVTREQDAVFATDPEPTVPCAVSSQVDRFYARPDGDGRLLVGLGYPKEYERVDPGAYDDEVDDAFEQDVRARVEARLPRLAGMRAVGGRVGLYDVTPDWHPLLGPVEGVEGLHLATGGSGHCFKLGPTIGELVANGLMGRKLKYADIAIFSLSRFAENRAFTSAYGGNRA